MTSFFQRISTEIEKIIKEKYILSTCGLARLHVSVTQISTKRGGDLG
jgi:hypothetical protein